MTVNKNNINNRLQAMKKDLQLPENACQVLAAIEDAGYEAWAVGGFVRDAILGRPCNDIDLASNATWQEVQTACEKHGMSTYEIGVKHGTLTVVPFEGADAVEVTTYRTDGKYSDARHPNSVKFVSSIEEDLGRRDFTINAIAWHPERGFMDPYGGLEDIETGTIRIIGDAKQRFAEDALRILRACRFVSQLGFTINSESYKAMVCQKCLLSKVSTERITHELDGLLLGEQVVKALMECADVIQFVLPEIVAMRGCEQRTPYHIYDVYEHTVAAVGFTPPVRLLRWAALCHDMGKPAAAFFGEDGREHFYGHAKVSAKMAQGMLSRLLMSNSFISNVKTLVLAHDDVLEPNPRSMRRALARLDGNVELFRDLLKLKKADILAHAPKFASQAKGVDVLEMVLEDVLTQEHAFTLRKLAINGEDVMRLGVQQGPEIGRLLKDALVQVVDGNIPNERDALLEFVKQQISA